MIAASGSSRRERLARAGVGEVGVDLVGHEQQAVPLRELDERRAATSAGYTAPVGLFGSITTSARVRGVTSVAR